MLTKDEVVGQLEEKLEEFAGREARHQGRIRATERILEFSSDELSDAEEDLAKVQSKTEKAEKYLEGEIPTATVEVVDEDTPRFRNIQKVLRA